ncbi:mitochondrial escape protein 2 [Entomophthora muscae]|uniref:Mitochondrial escape protein 2 n=1 Tax=Entomophthora muscae TaxID=34485 RepID=A0ACC2TV45_9FUNG|nr:mitochondrial escape protein 2 [Entomophthora muscae]
MLLARRVNHPLRAVYKLKPASLGLFKYSTDNAKQLKRGKIFINGIAPQFLGRLDPRIYLPSFSNDSIAKVRDDYVPESISFGAKLKDVEFRIKEGGAILEFEFLLASDKDSAQALQKITQEVADYIAAIKKKGFLNLMNIHVYPIKGEPFLEDLVFSLPTRILKVEFIGNTLCEEDLFKEFRLFGRISKITIHNPESSGFPKYALVHYFNANSATAARICLNGQRDCATRFSISYKKRDGKFWKWITSHPHIMLPLIIGSLLGLLYAVFDPVRVFCISSKISGRFDLAELSFLREMKKFALKLLKSRESSGLFDKMNVASGLEQEEKVYEIQQLLTGLPESFVYLQGPKGSGREVALLKSLEDKENVLHIFCDKVSQDSISIDFAALAKEVGYFPVFDVLNKAVRFADKFLVSMTGKSSDLSPSSEKQFQNLLDCTQLTLARFFK